MLLCLENLQGGFCDVSCSCIFISFLIFILLFFFVCRFSSFFFDVIPHPSVDCRWVFTPILCFQPSPLQSDLQHFRFRPFRSLLAAGATVLRVGIFYPQAFLALRSFTDILTCVYQGFPWGPAVLPWGLQGFILILGTQALPICLLDSQ